MKIKRTDGYDKDFLRLSIKLDNAIKALGHTQAGSWCEPLDNTDVFLMYDGDEAIGSAALRNDDGELCRIFTDGKYRGQGIASQLIAEVEKHALAGGRKELFLEAWANNTNAVKLYTKLGYSIAYQGPSKLTGDMFVEMRKKLKG